MDVNDMELLISLVENKPVLWDNTQECYKNRQSCFAAWREIFLALNEDFETLSEKEKSDFGKHVIKKWNNARDNWMKYNKKLKKCKSASGEKEKSLRKYKFYDKMLFLNKILIHPNTKASMNIAQFHNEETDSQNSNYCLNDEPSPSTSADKIKTNQKKKTVEDEDKSKSICFFKGIAPIVDKYSDEDYIEFQYEVIKVMRNLSRRNQASMQKKNYDNFNINQDFEPTSSSSRMPKEEIIQNIKTEENPIQHIPSVSMEEQEELIQNLKTEEIDIQDDMSLT